METSKTQRSFPIVRISMLLCVILLIPLSLYTVDYLSLSPDIRYLIDRGAAQSDLFPAIKGGDLPLVRALITAQPSLLSATDENGHTPLDVAALYKQKEIEEFLRKRVDSNRVPPNH